MKGQSQQKGVRSIVTPFVMNKNVVTFKTLLDAKYKVLQSMYVRNLCQCHPYLSPYKFVWYHFLVTLNGNLTAHIYTEYSDCRKVMST